jgi:hypothetical protein
VIYNLSLPIGTLILAKSFLRRNIVFPDFVNGGGLNRESGYDYSS